MRRRALLQTIGTTAGAVATGATGVGAVAPEPYAPLGRVDLPAGYEAVVGPDGATAYVATGRGFATVDVSDPADPTVLAVREHLETDDGGYLNAIWDVKVDGDRLLVAGPAANGDPKGFFVYDVSDPADPMVAVDFFETGFGIHNAYFQDGYAYIGASPAGPGISVVDATASPPEIVSTWSPADADVGVEGWSEMARFPGGCHDLMVHDGVAYCAFWDAGTWIVDVSDPAAPAYVGHAGDYSLEKLVEFGRSEGEPNPRGLEPPGNAHFVTVNDDASLLAVGGESWDRTAGDGHGGPSGIDLYDLADPASPERLATIDPPHAANEGLAGGTYTTAHNFDLRGDRLYSAWYRAGVKVHDVSDPADPERLVWWRKPDEAMFWTARVGKPGEFFVASSNGDGPPEPALYTFPDRAGEQADPPASVWMGERDPTTTSTTASTTTDPTPTTATTTTEATTTTGSTSATGGSTTTGSTASDTGATSGETPGFGVLAALGGIGLGTWWYRRSRGREGGE